MQTDTKLLNKMTEFFRKLGTKQEFRWYVGGSWRTLENGRWIIKA